MKTQNLTLPEAQGITKLANKPLFPPSWDEAIAWEQETADLLAEGGFVKKFDVGSLFDHRFEGIAASPWLPSTGGDRRDRRAPHAGARGHRARRARRARPAGQGSGPPGPQAAPAPPGQAAARLSADRPGPRPRPVGRRVRRRTARPGRDPGALDRADRPAAALWTDGTLPADILTSLRRAALGLRDRAGRRHRARRWPSGLSRSGEALIDGPVQVKRADPEPRR